MEVLDSEVLIICETKHHNDEYISKQFQADTGPVVQQSLLLCFMQEIGCVTQYIMCYSTESLLWLQWV